jgi:hypothetical protein
LVTGETRRSTNLTVLERFGARYDGSQLSTAEVTEALDQARAEPEACSALELAPTIASSVNAGSGSPSDTDPGW